MADDKPGWPDAYLPGWRDLAGVRALLDAGADPDAETERHRRPLEIAAEVGSAEVVAELAGRVAAVDAESNGRTALWTAVYHHRTDNVRALVDAGADPWRPMMQGWSPGRLSLAGPTPDLFTTPEEQTGLSADEAALVASTPELREIFDRLYFQDMRTEGLGMSCIADISVAEAVRRLDAMPIADPATGFIDRDFWPDEWDDIEGDIDVIGATDVPGGCILTQPWGYAPEMPGVLARLSAGTLAYGLYDNPKSGNQGTIYRDGSTEGWDLHPGGDPSGTSREIFVSYLARGNPVVYCCAFAGVHPPDARAVLGPPGRLAPPPRTRLVALRSSAAQRETPKPRSAR